MKQYSRKTSLNNSESMALLKNRTKKIFEDSIMDSKTFAEKWEPYIRDIGMTKEANGKKYYRSQEYSSIGIMDRNDLIQEAYLAFINAYSQVDWKQINKSEEPEAELWSYLKKRTILDTNIAIRNNKDGMRITQWAMYQGKDSEDFKNANINTITSLFNKMDVLFFRNQEDTAVTKWETDLLGYFLESKMDDYLDVKADGTRNYKGIEREVVSRFFGIDSPTETLKEIGESYEKDASTMRKVKQRALEKLKNDNLKMELTEFCKEYSINTQADIK